MKEHSIWLNGKLVPQAEAMLPVNSAAVFYASNVFEGLRAYWNEEDGELYCFRLDEHFARFRESMKMMRFDIPYDDDGLYEAVREVLTGNEIQEDVHMHMVAYVAGTTLDSTEPTGLYIIPRRRPRSDEAKGMSCNISSWSRTSDNAIPIRLKSGSNYQNGRLAILQSKADGYDQPIFLNKDGHVAEGSGASFFMVRKGRLVTAPITADILESITRYDADRHDLPGGVRDGRRRARDRPHGALRGRRGVLLRQRLRDHADHVDRSLPAWRWARSARSRGACRAPTSTSSGASTSGTRSGARRSTRPSRSR